MDVKVYFTERDDDEHGRGEVHLYAELDDPAVDLHTEGVPQVVYHSPTGVEYGYAGSGPADLALSILAHFYQIDADELAKKIRLAGPGPVDWTEDERRAVQWHQAFKFRLVAPADPEAPLMIHRAEIVRFIADQIQAEGGVRA